MILILLHLVFNILIFFGSIGICASISSNIADAVDMADEFEKNGAPAILIGGSGKSNHLTIDDLIKRIKQKYLICQRSLKLLVEFSNKLDII